MKRLIGLVLGPTAVLMSSCMGSGANAEDERRVEVMTSDPLLTTVAPGGSVTGCRSATPHRTSASSTTPAPRRSAQVQSVDEAVAAHAAGADALVAQGNESGGHGRDNESLWTLLPAVARAVSPSPVLAAGGLVALELAVQAIHVTSQSMIYQIDPAARSRLVGAYMVFHSIGSAGGAIASTTTYAHAGWTGVCLLGAAISATALALWAIAERRDRRRLIHCGAGFEYAPVVEVGRPAARTANGGER